MADKKADAKGTDVPDFAAQLVTVRPSANVELGEALRTLVQQVKDTGKAGTLTYSLQVKTVNGSQTMVTVADKITMKLPEKDRVPSIAFTDITNTLSRNDPSSMPLFEDDDIRTPGANIDTGEIKESPTL